MKTRCTKRLSREWKCLKHHQVDSCSSFCERYRRLCWCIKAGREHLAQRKYLVWRQGVYRLDPLEHEFSELTFAALLKSSLTVSHTWQGMANWGLFLKSWRKSWFVQMQIGSAVRLLQKSMPCSHRHICCLPLPTRPRLGCPQEPCISVLSSPKARLSLAGIWSLKG